MTETKVRDDLAVTFEVCALEVVEQPAPPSDHLQQALPAVMILRVSAEVVGQVVDVLGENCDLNLGRTRIGSVRCGTFRL